VLRPEPGGLGEVHLGGVRVLPAVERLGEAELRRRPGRVTPAGPPAHPLPDSTASAGIENVARSTALKASLTPAGSGGRTMRPSSSIHTAVGTLTIP